MRAPIFGKLGLVVQEFVPRGTLQFAPLYPPVHEYVQLPGVALYTHVCPTEVGNQVLSVQAANQVGLVAQENTVGATVGVIARYATFQFLIV